MTSVWDALRSSLTGLLARKLPNDYLTSQMEKAALGDICPICTFDGEARHIWLWSFMWENVNDPDTREAFIKAGGLCRADNWSMVEVSRNVIKSTMGVAIVYEHLVKVVTRALGRGKSSEPWIDMGRWAFDIGQECQACAIGAKAVRRSGDRLGLALVVKRRPEWTTRAFPLCHTHVRSLAWEATRPRVRRVLAASQRSAIEGLAASMQGSQSMGRKGRRRLEASLLPRGPIFAAPKRSESLYEGAIERCPVCETVAHREKELLENDLVIRERGADRALCLGHYLAVADANPHVGDSILSARLEEETGLLESMVTGLNKVAVSDRKASRRCAVCRGTRDAEEEIIGKQVTDWSSGRGPDDLMCLRHLGNALALIPRRERDRVVSNQLARLGNMLKELRDFIELHDYRSQQRPVENPDASYRWALRFLTSEPAIVASMLSIGGSGRFLPRRTLARTRRRRPPGPA